MANNVIDSLVVLLDLDPGKFDEKKKKALKDLRETKEEVRQGTEQYQKYGKSGGEAFKNVANEALRYLAVFAGAKAIKDFTQQTVTQGAALGRVAANAGVSTKSMAVWQQAVRSLGGDANAAGQTMFNLSQELQKFSLTGESSIVPYFRALGISLVDAKGHLKSVDDLLLDVADKVQNKQISPQQASFILSQLGISQDVINLIERGGTETRKYLDQAAKVTALNDANSASFEKLQNSWSNLVGAFDKGATTLLANVAPALSYILDLANKAANFLNTHNIYGDELDDNGNIKSKSSYTKGVERGINDNAKQGIIVDPYSGVVIPYTPSASDSAQAQPPAASTGDKTYNMIRSLEGSKVGQLGKPVFVGGQWQRAVGQNQILPTTATQHGLDPSRLGEEAYNDMAARKIEADLSKRYNGDPELIALAYHNGPGAADRYQRFGRNLGSLGPDTQKYLLNERAYVAKNGSESGDHTTTVNGDINIYTQATDADGISRDIKGKLASPDHIATNAQGGPF